MDRVDPMSTISEKQWVEYFGFRRFPFDHPGSGNEEFARPEFLASCFVEPPSFERAFGQADAPVTSLLFAARGTGKTACRVMMDYNCKISGSRLGALEKGEPNFILSVPHIKLDNVRDIAFQLTPNNKNLEISVNHHIIEIMRQAIPALVELIAGNDVLVDKVMSLYYSARKDLNSYIKQYSLYLTSQQKEFLRSKLGVEVSYSGEESRLMHLENLEKWSKLIQAIGIKAVYTMVDGIDEIMESAEDPDYAYHLIRPLVTHLRLMNGIPNFVLKFFIPSHMEQIVLSDPAFRRDRGFVIERIEWREEDLINILRKRLAALSKPDHDIRDQTAVSFDTLCVPELRGEIESDLARNANGNPRYLMNLCAQMVTIHCSREFNDQDNPFELNRDDYLHAVKQVESMYQGVAIRQKFQEGEVLLGRYKVEKIINTSHSQIIKAWDESLKRFVGIKSPQVDQFNLNESLVERFYKNSRREAELLAKLQHQNIGQVFDILEKPFGIIMEWVEGRSIQEILEKKERLSIYEIIMVGIGVADALAYAHHFGVIHRDINPKNIILTLDKTPKLVDFDVARDELLETITLREDGSRFWVGTPRYCSPEQLVQPDEISISEIGPASDVFSLGVVLFEMLTFEKPYEYGNRLAQYENNFFPKPKMHEIPDPLYRILLEMLDGKPSNRPKAAALKSELQNYLQTQNLTGGELENE